MTLIEAVTKLCEELRDDPELYFAWQSNIAMSISDEAYDNQMESVSNEFCNNAAKRFLDMLTYRVTDTEEV